MLRIGFLRPFALRLDFAVRIYKADDRTSGGELVSGSRDVWQCPVKLDDSLSTAYVKPIPKYQLVREVLCALVAQAVGLPIAPPGVASLEMAEIETSERFAFATLPHGWSARSMVDDPVLRKQSSRWPCLHSAIAFDAWIANPDRTPQNLLFRGTSDFVLIDHGEAIAQGLNADSQVRNWLARFMSSDLKRDEERVAVQRVQGAAARFKEVDFDRIQLASLAPGWQGDDMLGECCRFLTDRLNHIDSLIEQAFGLSQQTLPFREPLGGQKHL